jgi:membrane associated rhomboid family serine protease
VIIPISHEEGATRRWPWVTFAVMGACVLVFLFTDLEAIQAAPARSDHMEQAAHYWREHAYLKADPEVREHVAYDVMPNQRRQYLETLPELAEPIRPHDAESLTAEQAELDRLTALALGDAKPEGEPEHAFQRWGFTPDEPGGLGLLTHAFLHGGWFHLIGNLFLLMLAGPAIEDRWGRPLYTGFYALAGAFAAVVHMGLTNQPELPLVGASGAIAGVLGAFLVRLWKTKIQFAYFFIFGLRPVYGTFEAAAWVMLPLWFANELLQGWVSNSAGLASGVARWAHVGGFVFGVAIALAVRALRFEERFVNPSVEAQITHYNANPVLEAAMAAREQGEVGRALELLQAEWQREPDEDLGVALFDAALGCAQPELGAPALAGAVRAAVRRGDVPVALRHWATLTQHVPSARVDPGSLLRLVPALVAENQKDQAVLMLRQALDPKPAAALTGGLALRAAELAREIDPACALRAARLALASPDLHPAKREKLEALAAGLEAQGVSAATPPLATAPAEPGEVQPVVAEPEDVSIAIDEIPPALELPPDFEAGRDGIHFGRFARTKLTEARPRGLDGDTLRLLLEDGREGGVKLERIQAVATAVLTDLGPRPVLVIDLLANWNQDEAEELRGVRLRSDQFDPRQVLGIGGDAQPALRALVERLLEASGGVPLPSAEAAAGQPFARFALADYERDVLDVAE